MAETEVMSLRNSLIIAAYISHRATEAYFSSNAAKLASTGLNGAAKHSL